VNVGADVRRGVPEPNGASFLGFADFDEAIFASS
jgi:hypothetical protein